MAQAERVRLQPQQSHQLQVSGLKKRELRSACGGNFRVKSVPAQADLVEYSWAIGWRAFRRGIGCPKPLVFSC